MDECAYARANGTVGTLGVDGERDARERLGSMVGKIFPDDVWVSLFLSLILSCKI